MKIISSVVLATSAFVFCSAVSAQFAKPEDAIKYRKNALFAGSDHGGEHWAVIGSHFFFDDSSSMDDSGVDDLLFDDDVEKMIVLFPVKELEDRKKKKKRRGSTVGHL